MSIDLGANVNLPSVYSEQPDVTVDHNRYEAPKSRLERWKWFAGVDNSLDKEVQTNYDRMIQSLENVRPKTIGQLKGQMVAFWHADREMKDYKSFKAKAQERSGRIGKVFFAILGFLFKFRYNKSVLRIGKKLEERSKETFARIGNIKLNDQEYDVIATHELADEKTPLSNHDNETHRTFFSKSYGWTEITVLDKKKRTTGHKFHATIARPRQNLGHLARELTYEASCASNETKVASGERCLMIEQETCRGGEKDATESAIQLDRKLFQIMAEMAKQNKCKWISVECRNRYSINLCNELGREKLGREKREPVLKPDAGILPEYWARKPMIIEQTLEPTFRTFLPTVVHELKRDKGFSSRTS